MRSLGKNNSNNNKNKKKENYFDQKIKQLGEDFMVKINPQDLKKDANRILKDIAYANIDFANPRYLRYFADPNFVQLLLRVSYENWHYNNVTCIGLEYYLQSNNANMDSNIMQIYEIHDLARKAYAELYNGLNALMQYLIQCNQSQQQVMMGPVKETLFILVNRVVQYNKGMNYTFVVVVNNNRRPNSNDKRPYNKDKGDFKRFPDNDDRR